MTDKPKPPTHAEIAAAMGLSPRRVRQLKAEGMPDHCLSAALAWRQVNTAPTDSAERLRQERIKLVIEQRTAKELENQRLRRELVPAGEVVADLSRVVSGVRGEFLKMAADLPPKLAGLSESQMQPVIRHCVIEILTRLSNETSELYQP
jgi:hypothetical protein